MNVWIKIAIKYHIDCVLTVTVFTTNYDLKFECKYGKLKVTWFVVLVIEYSLFIIFSLVYGWMLWEFLVRNIYFCL
jgi:hypothetical protein